MGFVGPALCLLWLNSGGFVFVVNKILLLSPQETFGPLRKICVSDFTWISVDFKGFMSTYRIFKFCDF